MGKVKIKVERMLTLDDLIEKYASPGGEKCHIFNEGDEFISEDFKKPENFCDWAWVDIQRDVVVLAAGGNYPWNKDKRIQFSCCTGGLTPVVFKLERIEE
jgi:uncharacterized repeat protein (TIGR04076 family)